MPVRSLASPRPAVTDLLPALGRALLTAVVAATGVGAQPATRQQAHAWLTYFGDHAIARRTALYVELSARRADGARTWQQQVAGVGVTRAIGARYRVTGTLIAQRSFPYLDDVGGTRVDELRPWFQLAGQHPIGAGGATSWADRTRVELRWQRRDVDFDADGTWLGTWRLRRQDRVTRRLDAAGRWYLAGSQEWFVSRWPWEGGALFEQSRTQLALGRQAGRTLRVEGGYMLQWLERPAPRPRELNHTLTITLRSAAALR